MISGGIKEHKNASGVNIESHTRCSLTLNQHRFSNAVGSNTT